MSKTILFRLFALLLITAAAVYGYLQYNKPHENMQRAEVDMQLSAEELLQSFEQDEAAANEKYLDKVIAVSGIVRESRTTEEGQVQVTLEAGDGMMSGVSCQLDELSDHDRIAFTQGEKVTFKGKCTGYLMEVVLVRCVEIPQPD